LNGNGEEPIIESKLNERSLISVQRSNITILKRKEKEKEEKITYIIYEHSI
jgi:hypothetical protein